MEASTTTIQEITKDLINALPIEAEDDYQAWLADPSEDGLVELLEKYHIDADKIARSRVLEENENV